MHMTSSSVSQRAGTDHGPPDGRGRWTRGAGAISVDAQRLPAQGNAPGNTPRNAHRGHREVAPVKKMFGGVLLSHILSGAVPLALAGLTSGFGMGPGVSLPLWPP